MKAFLTFLLSSMLIGQVAGQSIVLGQNARFNLGSSASFFAGGNTTLNGTFNNQGTIISYSDLDVQDNTTMANLRFVGPGNQTLTANDTLRIGMMTMEKDSVLTLDLNRLIVRDGLDIVTGVLGAGADTTLIVSGEITGGGDDGYVEGKLVHLVSTDEINFPLGNNGFFNGLTLTGIPDNTIVVVEVRRADPDRLLPTNEMIGIADEVEWEITVVSSDQDSIEVGASATFNGVDLTLAGLPNGADINSDSRGPSLAKFGRGDSLYVDLGIADLFDTDRTTFGTVVAQNTFFISEEPTLISIALVPLLDAPEFFVPNAFSPTGVFEENRVFRPYFAGGTVTSYSLTVWDQFQNRLYSISEAGPDLDLSLIGWDGRLSNGEIADEGIYYYSTTVVTEEETYNDIGSVLLVN